MAHLKYCRTSFARAVVILTEYNITHGRPSVWVQDLKFLRLFPEGVHWLNNFPFQLLHMVEWEQLRELWQQITDVHAQLPGFVGIILNSCIEIDELLEFLSIFGEVIPINRILMINPTYYISVSPKWLLYIYRNEW